MYMVGNVHVLVSPVNVCGGQGAHDNNVMLRRTLHLSQFGKDAVGLASHFSYIFMV